MEEKELYRLAHYVCQDKNIPIDEDIIQEMVIEAWKQLPKYDSTRGAESNFICHVMFNKYRMLCRENRRHISTVSLDEVVHEDKDGNCVCLIDTIPYEDNNIRDVLNKESIIMQIEHLYTPTMWLHILGYSHKEIAEKLGISRQAVAQRLFRNIQTIKQYCKENNLCL